VWPQLEILENYFLSNVARSDKKFWNRKNIQDNINNLKLHVLVQQNITTLHYIPVDL